MAKSVVIDKALARLQSSGVQSIVMLRTLVNLTEPRTAAEIEDSTGLDRGAMRRFALRHPGLVKKVRATHIVSEGQGRPTSTAYVLSAKGQRLIEAFLGK